MNQTSQSLENPEYLQSQLITYIGNKRALLGFIGEGVKLVQSRLKKEKLNCLDVFAGSGIVSRYLKQYSNSITVNDLESYSSIINHCYLSNKNEIALEKLHKIYDDLCEEIDNKMAALERDGSFKTAGFISELYSPSDEENILKGERCFYTPYNAAYLDVASQLIREKVSVEYQDYFIAPLLSEASIHANTAGIFKGFYKNSKTGAGQFGGNGKNALSRIKGKIHLPFPELSEFCCKTRVFRRDANTLVASEDLYNWPELGLEQQFDLAYLDPPYNQHPYGSNYFMLNLVADYKRPDSENISRVSGIPRDWNRSAYNKKKKVAEVFIELVKNIRAKYVLVSFNSEGFIEKDLMIELLSQCGKVEVLESEYNTFRGSRNLNAREIHVKEYLFLLEK